MIPLLLALLGAAATAAPSRAAIQPPFALVPGPGRAPDLLMIKLAEGAGLRWEGGALAGPGDLAALNALLVGARPRFAEDAALIAADRATYDPEGRLADLRLHLRLRVADPVARGQALLADPRIEAVWLAYGPVPPPVDLDPATPDFSAEQGWLGPAPAGFGFDEAGRWPGGRGDNVAVADIEYGWVEDHEDLEAAIGASAWGWDSASYPSHGTSVLGELVGGDNGYGVVGAVPDAEPLLISPYATPGDYDVAAAVVGATALLDAGDVLLIEQQAWSGGRYCPVEVDPAVFDAISLAVARGIVVVEPGGNGAANLDAADWGGWFDRDVQDSGAIVVGGGASPDSGLTPRAWYPSGSSYGSRVDVQGWYDHIVTAAGDSADLYYPAHDARQGYTAAFGGTSGASPMVAAAAAVAQSVAWQRWGAPWDPMDLRAALVSTGTPDASGASHPIGPQPDLRRLLWTWMAH